MVVAAAMEFREQFHRPIGREECSGRLADAGGQQVGVGFGDALDDGQGFPFARLGQSRVDHRMAGHIIEAVKEAEIQIPAGDLLVGLAEGLPVVGFTPDEGAVDVEDDEGEGRGVAHELSGGEGAAAKSPFVAQLIQMEVPEA